ncbi:hypothetical protein POSPLADRAFT_1050225 [Postia placenta MAD-698-R-SB12]|uniref:F-box domain-containing protein n=1 Tax=Postia placenta MAD-698-R-SB12 TaxID=670580 RepID=A0A1X6MLM5_9APHY|nr:hypothetical protein POSPLADRAFT_1050225 [Postia placenta MAD-698-R-SB12]OSX57169.1 hypothetical protein POSPLADRAFT_1050225 [Postia placenta MAD-698-R-SB12]
MADNVNATDSASLIDATDALSEAGARTPEQGSGPENNGDTETENHGSGYVEEQYWIVDESDSDSDDCYEYSSDSSDDDDNESEASICSDDEDDGPELKEETSTPSVTASHSGQPPSASKLLTLSLDLILEITSYLLPSDLITLVDTNRSFRSFLMSPDQRGVWKMALQRVPDGTPPCPPDVSEPQWARLILGGPKCQKMFEETALSAVYNQLKDDVRLHKAGAEQALETFCMTRKSYVRSVYKFAAPYADWMIEYTEDRAREREERDNVRYGEALKRFMELSYEQQDIESIRSIICASDHRITDTNWMRVRGRLEPHLIKALETRIARERRHLIHSRIKALEPAYNNYKRTLTPIQWTTLPRLSTMRQVPEIDDLVNDDSDAPPDLARYEAAFSCAPEVAEELSERRREGLYKELGAAGHSHAMEIDRLSLATAVFKCVATRPCTRGLLFSWAEVQQHNCGSTIGRYGSRWQKYRYFIRDPVKASPGQRILDPNTSRPEDLDRIDARFICTKCLPNLLQNDGSRHVLGYEAFCWRRYVAHVEEERHPLRFCKLTPSTCWARIKELEIRDWYRCHAIESPREDEDFFLAYRGSLPLRVRSTSVEVSAAE